MVTFRETAEEHLGARLTCVKLEEVGMTDTLQYVLYADKNQHETTFPDLDEETMPEVGDEYVHTLVMLLRGSQMMCGTVRACKQDLDGNPILPTNPILDMQLNDIKFSNGEVNLLTANAITQAMYAQ